VLGLAAVLLALVLIVPRLLYPPLADRELDQDAVTGTDRLQLRNDRLQLQNDARATLLQGLAGGVLLLGAYFTWRQLQRSRQQLNHTLQATGEQLDATRKQLAIAREGQLAERFSRAIEHLGSPRTTSTCGSAVSTPWSGSPPARRATDEPSPASLPPTSADMPLGPPDPRSVLGSVDRRLHPWPAYPASRPVPPTSKQP
jgi:hypothetical protein